MTKVWLGDTKWQWMSTSNPVETHNYLERTYPWKPVKDLNTKPTIPTEDLPKELGPDTYRKYFTNPSIPRKPDTTQTKKPKQG